MDGLEVVYEHCHVEIVKISRDECADPVSVYSKKCSRERRETHCASGAAGHVDDELFAEVNGATLSINFKLLEVPVLGDLRDGC